MNHSIDRIGNLIAVCGNSGSGKSTLVRHALQQLPKELIYMNTLTTRPRRTNEDDIEYTFVSDVEYDNYKQLSKIWDESSIYGNRYAVNASDYIEALDRGENVIFCSIPSFEVMNDIRSIYGTSTLKTVQLMTGIEVSTRQAKVRDHVLDIGRVSLDAVMNRSGTFEADYTLEPSGSLTTDQINFLNIIRRIIL
jgi:ribose 1,5-bisphosphokinase PhnN